MARGTRKTRGSIKASIERERAPPREAAREKDRRAPFLSASGARDIWGTYLLLPLLASWNCEKKSVAPHTVVVQPLPHDSVQQIV